MKLTKRAIDGFKYQGKETENGGMTKDIRWDDQIPAFGVRVFPSERRTFVLFYRAQNRQRFMTLGQYGILTLDQARDKAKSFLGKIVDGVDPLLARKKEQAGQTVKVLAEAYIERYAKLHKKTWRTDRDRISKYILPAFGNLPVKSVIRSDVGKWHHKIGQVKPYEANRNLALLSKMFNCSKEWGFVEETGINPAMGIEKFKEQKRDRWLTPEELPRLTKAIDGVENTYARGCLWLYLLTGCRKTELLRTKWQDVDFDRQELRLPETKAGGTHYIPLSGPAVEIFKNLPRIDGNPFVFPGRNIGQPLINIDKIWRKVRKEAKVEDIRLHDLRRTVGSWLAQSGSSLHLIGRVLNHSNASTTQVYARFAQDHVKKALEDHGKQIMKIARGEQNGKRKKQKKS